MQYTKEKLKEVLKAHALWLAFEGGQRADFRDADFRDADLRDANLRDADFRDADFRDADLCDANLRGADLRGADLCGADLCGADLRDADFRDADFRDADLCDANLRGADLRGADLCGANLRDANFRDANFRGAKNISQQFAAMLLSCPEAGSFVAWKKCQNNVIVKLLIPENSKRSSATGRKCRAEFVKVLEVFGSEAGISSHDGVTKYEKGKTVKCDKWEENRWIECGGGIHFFITRAEAEAY